MGAKDSVMQLRFLNKLYLKVFFDGYSSGYRPKKIFYNFLVFKNKLKNWLFKSSYKELVVHCDGDKTFVCRRSNGGEKSYKKMINGLQDVETQINFDHLPVEELPDDLLWMYKEKWIHTKYNNFVTGYRKSKFSDRKISDKMQKIMKNLEVASD